MFIKTNPLHALWQRACWCAHLGAYACAHEIIISYRPSHPNYDLSDREVKDTVRIRIRVFLDYSWTHGLGLCVTRVLNVHPTMLIEQSFLWLTGCDTRTRGGGELLKTVTQLIAIFLVPVQWSMCFSLVVSTSHAWSTVQLTHESTAIFSHSHDSPSHALDHANHRNGCQGLSGVNVNVVILCFSVHGLPSWGARTRSCCASPSGSATVASPFFPSRD